MVTGHTHRTYSPKRVFLSYGHDHMVSFALRLKKDLEDVGHEVWFDADRIKPGTDWEQYIEDGLSWVSENSINGCFLLLMTPYSVRRPDGFCLNELSRAIQLNLKVIPIMLALCEPPLSICRIQWLDMQDCVSDISYEKYQEKLVLLLDVIANDNRSFMGPQTRLSSILKPISFDAEIKYNIGRFVGREWVLKSIESWLAEPGAQRIFWITGSPGVGKTSISSWLCAHRLEVAAFHFCRHENAQKIEPRRCIMSLAYQLSTQLPEYEERLNKLNLADIENMNARALFDMLIVQPFSKDYPSTGRTVLIVIDALDEATVNGRNDLAEFIASEFERTPPWLRMVFTSRPDPEVAGPLQAYNRFHIGADDERNREDIYNFLAREMENSVSPEIINQVTDKCNGLFIYAEYIIRELKQGRLSLDNLDGFPKGLGGIYLQFFLRQFPDTGKWESRIRPALEIIAASQEPLSLKVISAIFKWNIHEEREFKRLLGSLFIVENEKVQPFHQSVMEWLTDENKDDRYFVSEAEGHLILGDFLLGQYHKGRPGWNQPLMKYLPIHLCMSERIDDLMDVLRNMEFVSMEWSSDRFNVMRWWALAEERSDLRMTTLFKEMVESPASYGENELRIVASILTSSLRLEESNNILEHLVARYRNSGRADELREALSKQAFILVDMSDYERALPLLEELERTCRDQGDLDRLQRSLLARAEALWKRNEFDESLKLLLEQEHICRDTGNYEGLWASLNEQSTIQRVKGNIGKAMSLLKEQESICRNIGNVDGLKESLFNQGQLLKATGKLDPAIRLFQETEALSKKTNDKENLITTMNAIAMIDSWRGHYDQSIEALKKTEALCRELKYIWGLWDTLCSQSCLMRQKGDLNRASQLIDEALKICRDMANMYGVQCCLGQQAIILRLRGDLDGAKCLHKEEERICREIGHKRDLAMSLNNQAVILRLKGDFGGAMKLHLESEVSLRELNYRYGLQDCLGNKALTLYAKGDPDAALASLHEQESICRDMKLTPDLEKCLAAQKMILQGMEMKVPALTK